MENPSKKNNPISSKPDEILWFLVLAVSLLLNVFFFGEQKK